MTGRLHGLQETPEEDLQADYVPLPPYAIRAPELRLQGSETPIQRIFEGAVLVADQGRFGGGPSIIGVIEIEAGSVWTVLGVLDGLSFSTSDFAGQRIRYVVEATVGDVTIRIPSQAVTVEALLQSITADTSQIRADSTVITADAGSILALIAALTADQTTIRSDSTQITADRGNQA